MPFVKTNVIGVEKAKKIEHVVIRTSVSIPAKILLKICVNVPLAAKPKSAMLTTMDAKWYHWMMENILTRNTSNDNMATEIKNVPI
jgi:hypothetical protein